MSLGPYNPQEVLTPLLRRFGRHLHEERDRGFEQMVSAICEDLKVDVEHARKLLRHLECAGLVVYEELVMPKRQGAATWEGKPASGAPAVGDERMPEASGWRIGPRV